MPEEGPGIELAQKFLEESRPTGSSDRRAFWVELIEVIVLAAVAVSTAWSGFEAAKWSGLSGRQYSYGLRRTVLAAEKATLGGQDRLYDITTFNDWVRAKVNKHEDLATWYERRFRPEYAVAFQAWHKLDPFHNSSAGPGPIFMPEYANANAEESARLTAEAAESFDKGMTMRENSDEYIRVTVFLATVLLLTAIGQRLRRFWPRAALVMVALVLLCTSAYRLLTLPRVW
jgi:hypothetical protein